MTNEEAALLQGFDKFKQQIDEAYDLVRESLVDGRYEDAQRILEHIGQTHARTSVSMRNWLIKRGKIKADE